jgi:hypothetical protein
MPAGSKNGAAQITHDFYSNIEQQNRASVAQPSARVDAPRTTHLRNPTKVDAPSPGNCYEPANLAPRYGAVSSAVRPVSTSVIWIAFQQLPKPPMTQVS